MRRFALLATLLGALTVTAASVAAPVAHPARSTTIQLHRTGAGTILTTAAGRTIYVFTRDRHDRDMCAAVSGCAAVWPLVTSSGGPVAGRGVSGDLLGTIRVRGARQVTYAGRPLYTYRGDTGPGETSYIGISQFGGAWYGLTAQGGLVR
jgi:predicted lipoprotein with Yx(FWY)xxD motif